MESNLGAPGNSPIGLSQIRMNCAVLGLQIMASDSSSVTLNSDWVPNFNANIATVPQKISGIAKQTAPGWGLIQQVAQAYGDLAWWDMNGTFRYETNATWRTKRFSGTFARTLKGDRIFNGTPRWGRDSVRKTVTVPVVVPQVVQSTVENPAWVATDIYTVPARSKISFSVELDYSIYNIKAIARGFNTAATSSWIRTSRADAVGDPAAKDVGGLTVAQVTPTSTGLQFTFANANNFPIAIWSAGNGGSIGLGPYLVIHGTKLVFPDSRLITVATSAAQGDDLVIDATNWRQDPDQANLWANSIAADTAQPLLEWASLTIPLDPRLSLGDVLNVMDSRFMDVFHPLQIVGISYDMPSKDKHTMTLQVRGAYAPTGWVLGVPARSILNQTTQLGV
jgi:hypothetical protein